MGSCCSAESGHGSPSGPHNPPQSNSHASHASTSRQSTSTHGYEMQRMSDTGQRSRPSTRAASSSRHHTQTASSLSRPSTQAASSSSRPSTQAGSSSSRRHTQAGTSSSRHHTQAASSSSRPSTQAGSSSNRGSAKPSDKVNTVQNPPPVFRWPTPPPFQPVQYVPASAKEAIRGYPALRLLSVAHSKLRQGGNHWCFYLPRSENRSVRIDPNPTGPRGTLISDGTKANIVVSRLPYKVSNNAQHTATISTRPGLRIADFVDAIVDAGRHRYEFDREGSGCRKWVTDQIDLFVERGFVTDLRQAEIAKEAILVEFDKRAPTEKRYPVAQGVYYP